MSEEKQTNNPNYSTPIAIVIAGLIIAAAVFYTQSPNTTQQNPSENNPTPVVNNQPTGNTEGGTILVSIDDDPVLGDANAPITIIEFSDYECPFCKRSYEQTMTQVKSNYIDEGKVKLVFRDLPLSFHDPVATEAAVAANCARDQGGDEAYFKFHDEYFKLTGTNGAGVAGGVEEVAGNVGLNVADFNTCMNSGKHDQEVRSDLAAAQSVGATGTPAYFIGYTTEDGNIEGIKINGAQPYQVFEAEIESLLSEL